MVEKRVAVLSDAVSPVSYFPLWHRYYGRLFGAQNLYLVTYEGMLHQFRDYELGGIWEIPHRYDDNQRAKTITALAKTVLTCYSTLLRVDIDEIAVPNPELYPDLGAYIAATPLPYVTARGMNVILHPDEAPLDLHRPVLIGQRNFVHPVGPLNKTCLTLVAMDWDPGFHFTSHFPMFDDLFIFHLKHADFEIQLKWGEWMLEQVKGNAQFENYYRPDMGKMRGYQGTVLSYPLHEGIASMYRTDFIQKFLSGVRYDPRANMYSGKHIFEDALVKIAGSFNGQF